MNIDEKIIKRFQGLIEKGEEVKQSRYQNEITVISALGGRKTTSGQESYNSGLAEGWGTSTLAFLDNVLKKSVYRNNFFLLKNNLSDPTNFDKALAILTAAKEDFEGGYLFDTKRAITADVFDDFLDQAKYLLSEGYFQVAAVIAGAVLEDTLRKISSNKSIPLPQKPKLDSMNSNLVKAGAYDKTTQKKVTWLADLRNKAAHGKWNEFSEKDTEEMIESVQRFVEDNL